MIEKILMKQDDIKEKLRKEIQSKKRYMSDLNLNDMTQAAILLLNRLNEKNVFNANITICADTEEESECYGKILGSVLEEYISKQCVVLDEEAFYDEKKRTTEWKEYSVFVVKDFQAKDSEKVYSALEKIEKDGWSSIVIFCTVTEVFEKLKDYDKQDYRLYYYLLGKKVIVSKLNTQDILSNTLNKLKDDGFEITDQFNERLELYIDTVYPEARLQEGAFINDLVERIYQMFYQKIFDEKKLKTEDVPYSEKVKKILDNKTNEKVRPKLEIQEPYANEDENSEGKNVLILSLSMLPGKNEKSYYSMVEQGKNGINYQVFSGVSQLEPGTKYIINKLASQGKRIDHIIVLTTLETWGKKKNYGDKSAVDVYSENIKNYILQSQNSEESDQKLEAIAGEMPGYIKTDCKINQENIHRLEDKKKIEELYPKQEKSSEQGNDYPVVEGNHSAQLDELRQYVSIDTILLNDNSLIRTVSTLNELAASDGKGVNLFVDLQGGSRSFMFTLFATLTMLRDKNVHMREMFVSQFASNNQFHPMQIVNKEYAIIDLVSGIRAFTRYGKAGELEQFYKSRKIKDENMKSLLKIMMDIDGYMQINNPEDFNAKLKELVSGKESKENLLEYPEGCLLDSTEYKDSQFKLVVDDLRETYAPIILNNPTDLDRIQWFAEKEFTTSALTFVEDKFPEIFLGNLYEKQYKKQNNIYSTDSDFFTIKFNVKNDEDFEKMFSEGSPSKIINRADFKQKISELTRGQFYYEPSNNILLNINKETQYNSTKDICNKWFDYMINRTKNKTARESLYYLYYAYNPSSNNYDEHIENIKNSQNKQSWPSESFTLWKNLISLKLEIKVNDMEEVLDYKNLEENLLLEEIDFNNIESLKKYALMYVDCKVRKEAISDKTKLYKNPDIYLQLSNCSKNNKIKIDNKKLDNEHYFLTFAGKDSISILFSYDTSKNNIRMNPIQLERKKINDKKLKEELDKELEICIRLYSALKGERNTTNHADANGQNHMHYKATKKAILVFVKLVENVYKILEEIKNKTRNNI